MEVSGLSGFMEKVPSEAICVCLERCIWSCWDLAQNEEDEEQATDAAHEFVEVLRAPFENLELAETREEEDWLASCEEMLQQAMILLDPSSPSGQVCNWGSILPCSRFVGVGGTLQEWLLYWHHGLLTITECSEVSPLETFGTFSSRERERERPLCHKKGRVILLLLCVLQVLLDHVGWELPLVVVKYVNLSQPCLNFCYSIIEALAQSCNPRELFAGFMEVGFCISRFSLPHVQVSVCKNWRKIPLGFKVENIQLLQLENGVVSHCEDKSFTTFMHACSCHEC